MATFKAKLKVLDFDADRWLKEFERKMVQQNRLGAGEWLRAVLTRVPVRSGMAQASLLPLAHFLSIRHAGEMFEIFPVEKSRIDLGESLSDDPATMFTTNGRGTFTFSFDINVLHYYLNEFGFVGPYKNPINPAIQPPWNSMEAGEAAYDEYISENVQLNVPRILDFTNVTEVNV